MSRSETCSGWVVNLPLPLAFLCRLLCKTLGLFICVPTFLVSVAVAQYSSGIEGIVKDPSGAVVVSAQVTIHNENLGVRRDTTTNENGFFRVTELAPGVYRVEIQVP